MAALHHASAVWKLSQTLSCINRLYVVHQSFFHLSVWQPIPWARRAHLEAAAPAEVSFEGLDVEVLGTDLAWLYNLVAALAHSPIQDAITREVAAQVRPGTTEGLGCFKDQGAPLAQKSHGASARTQRRLAATLHPFSLCIMLECRGHVMFSSCHHASAA